MLRLFLFMNLLLLSSALPQKATAQDSSSLKKVILSTALLEYWPNPKLNTVNCNLGAELYLKNSLSLYLNAGVLLSAGSPNSYFGIPSEQSQGYKFRLEMRRYLKRKKVIEPAMLLFWPHVFQYHNQPAENSGFYTGLSSSYQWTETKRKENVENPNYPNNPMGESQYIENYYFVSRNVLCLNGMIGFQCIKKSGITVDYAVGLGIQFVNSHSRNRLGSDQDYPNSTKDYPMDKYFDYGFGIAPNLLYQIRIGFGL